MRRWIEQQQVLTLGIAATVAFLLWELRIVCIVLFASYIIATALRPAVDRLERTMPAWPGMRVVAVVMVYLALAAVFFGVVVPATVVIGGEMPQLSSSFTSLQQEPLGTTIQNALSQSITYIEENIFELTTSTLALFASALSVIIASAYIVYDWHRLHEVLLKHRTPLQRSLGRISRQSEQMLGAWVRGQLLLSLAVGVLVFLATLILGVPFAPVLGVVAGFTEFIPYIGPFLGAAPAVLLALNVSLTKALIVAAAYLIIQQVESHLLVPLIMRRSVALHPVAVIAALLAGFTLLGFAGLLLAVPIAATVRIVFNHFWYA